MLTSAPTVSLSWVNTVIAAAERQGIGATCPSTTRASRTSPPEALIAIAADTSGQSNAARSRTS